MSAFVRFLLLGAAFASATAFARPGEMRAAFLERYGGRFRGASLVPAAAVEASHDFERAKGQNTWFIALPVDDDDRVRFLEATIREGRFQKGVLRTFGFQEERITAARFAKLRAEGPMVALRAGSAKVVKKDGKSLPPYATLHAPLSRPLVYRAPPHPMEVVVNPVGRILGHFRGGCARLGMSLSALAYRVTLEGPDGVTAVIGVGTEKGAIPRPAAVAAIRAAVEAAAPARRGCVSDRDVADFYGASTVRLEPDREAK